MSTDSSNPILRRLGVAGVGDERHFKAKSARVFIETTKNSPFTTTENLLRPAYGSQGINHEKKQIPLVLGQPLAVVV